MFHNRHRTVMSGSNCYTFLIKNCAYVVGMNVVQ
ncbi:uncharacterized protein METZ01_LOCUS121885, partial [marine metagenome]